jgi:hypothetical protein
MTTILGIKTADEEAVVLAADTQVSLYEKGERTGKIISSKISTGKNYAIAFAGSVDKYVESFLSYLAGTKDIEKFIKFVTGEKDPERTLRFLGFETRNLRKAVQDITKKDSAKSDLEKILLGMLNGEIKPKTDADNLILGLIRRTEDPKPLINAIAEGYLPELALTNRYLLRRTAGEEDSDTVELILATNDPIVELYHVNPFGDIRKVKTSDLDYVCLGTGSELVKTYINEEQYEQDPLLKGKIKLDNVTIPLAIRLAICALKIASKDASTGGFVDLAVVRHGSIESHGKSIRGAIETAEEEAYGKIIKVYEPEEN